MKTSHSASRGDRRDKSGQALTEFAIALPLLSLLLFAIIQYGFIFAAYVTLRHGAHYTARTAALAGADSGTSNMTAIAKAAITPMLDPTQLESVVVTSNEVSGISAMNAQLTYDLPLIISFVVPGASSGTMVLKADATYRSN